MFCEPSPVPIDTPENATGFSAAEIPPETADNEMSSDVLRTSTM